MYYVRVIEEDTLLVNGVISELNLMLMVIQFQSINVTLITEDYEEECLGPGGHRAWSSPIFVDYKEKVSTDIMVSELNNISQENEESKVN